MSTHIGQIKAVEFGYTEIAEEYDDDTVKLVHHEAPGTFTITVTGLPDDMRWSAGMTVSIEETP